jgi:hypothetical protein
MILIEALYELRWLLEPSALRAAMVATPSYETTVMMDDLRKVMRTSGVPTLTDGLP